MVGVVRLHVSLQVVGGDETLGTDPAPVGLLSRVDPLVNCQVGAVGEGLLTLGTDVGLRLLVFLHVNPQTSSVGKTFLTGGALVRFVTRVDVVMFLQ